MRHFRCKNTEDMRTPTFWSVGTVPLTCYWNSPLHCIYGFADGFPSITLARCVMALRCVISCVLVCVLWSVRVTVRVWAFMPVVRLSIVEAHMRR